MKKLILTLENGEKYLYKLLEEEAPETVKAVCAEFPLEVKIMHARFAGEGIFYKIDMADVPQENPTTNAKPGMLTLHLGSAKFKGKAVHIWYGDNTVVNHAENLFGSFEGDFVKLKTFGERIWTEGPEKAKVEFIEE